MHEASGFSPDDEVNATIPDVSNLPLDVVLGVDDSALSNALRRLVREMNRPGENYAAHGTTP